MWLVLVPVVGGGKKPLSNSVADCCKLGTEPNWGNHTMVSIGHLLSSAAWKFLLPYTWTEMEKWENLSLCTFLFAQLMPDSSPAFLPQWSISKSMLGTRLWSLKRHWLWPQYKGMYHFLQLSLRGDNLRYSSWWHLQTTYQLLLDSGTQLSQRWCFWYCLGVGIPLPRAWWHPW